MRRICRGSGKDAGNAQLVLLLAMIGALFLSVMVIRVGHADDMRTRAQTAADAAALATLQPLRRAAVRFAREMVTDPSGIGYWYNDGGHRRAIDYADRNGADLDGRPHITGILGHTVKVDVKTQDCQLIPEDQLTEQQKRDLKNPAKLCTDAAGNKGIGRVAHAGAIAQLQLPTCRYNVIFTSPTSVIHELYCDGGDGEIFVSSDDGRRAPWNAVSQLFKVRLVGEEDPMPYTGRPAPRVSPGVPGTPAQVRQWISEAIKILLDHGVPAGLMNPDDIAIIIMHESGGNPTAINLWDSNAKKGTPSKGLMQTIDPTFNAHKLPGYNNIYAPVDNIIAGVRYAIDRYGSVSQVPGVLGVKNGTGYVGY